MTSLMTFFLYFILSFLFSLSVSMFIEIPICFDPKTLRNIYIIGFILLLLLIFSKVLIGKLIVYFATILGLGWGLVHSGTSHVHESQSALILMISNLGEIHPQYMMGYQNCRLKKVRGHLHQEKTILISHHFRKNESRLFEIGEFRSIDHRTNPHKNSTVQEIQKLISNRIYAQISFFEKRQLASWVLGIILGQTLNIPENIKQAFQITGLYHLLSVGGLHIAVLTFLIQLLLKFPFSVAYCFFLFPKPNLWPFFWSLLTVLSCLISIFFMFITGCDPAIQRSVICFSIISGFYLFWGKKSWIISFLAGLSIQALLYPIGFLSEGNLMSWLCALRLSLEFRKNPEKKMLYKLRDTILLQSELALYASALFGHLSIIGIFINPCLIGVFGAIFCLLVFSLIIDSDFINIFASACVHNYLAIIQKISMLDSIFSWTYVNLGAYPWYVRGLSVALASVFLLNLLKKASIGKSEDSDDGSTNLDRKIYNYR